MVDCSDICEGTENYFGMKVCPFSDQILTWQLASIVGIDKDHYPIRICEGAYESKEEIRATLDKNKLARTKAFKDSGLSSKDYCSFIES